jgi:hypothetical protein
MAIRAISEWAVSVADSHNPACTVFVSFVKHHIRVDVPLYAPKCDPSSYYVSERQCNRAANDSAIETYP